MPSYTIPQLQELLNKQYEALKTNETVREELIVEMKSEIKSLHKKLDLQMGSNNPLNLKDKGFGFHGSGSPRSKPYHEILSDSFKKLKEEIESQKGLCNHIEKLNKKNYEEKVKLKKENEEMISINKKLREEIESLKNELEIIEQKEFDYGESDDWAWGYGSVQKDNEYVIHISGGGDGVSPNGFEDWVIKKHSPNELEYFIRHGGNIPDKLQKDKIIISSPDGNYVSFANKDIFEIMADRLGETDFEWLLDDEDFLCYEEEE